MSHESPAQPSSAPVVKRSNRNIAVLLIGAGAFILLYNSGVFGSILWSALLPLAMLAVGFDLVTEGAQRRRAVSGALIAAVVLTPLFSAAHFLDKNEPRSAARSPQTKQIGTAGEFDRVRAHVKLTAGQLSISSLSDQNGAVLSLASEHGQQHQFHKDGRTGVIDIDQGPFAGDDLELGLTRRVPVELAIEMGAGQAGPLDFEDIQLQKLDLTVGTGSMEVALPEQGKMEVNIGGQFGGVEVDVPDDLAARIEVTTRWSELEVDDRFQLQDGVYVSEGYDENGDNQATIRITTTGGSIKVH